MTTNRRQFLAGAGAAGFATIMLPGKLFADFVIPRVPVLEIDYYSARVGDWLYLYDEYATNQDNLQLVSVTDSGSNKHVQQFALTLRSLYQAAPMPTGHYAVAGETFELFVQHTHAKAGRQYYRAVFALLRQDTKAELTR